jgi:hypothetical protein
VVSRKQIPAEDEETPRSEVPLGGRYYTACGFLGLDINRMIIQGSGVNMIEQIAHPQKPMERFLPK